jgi:hypothetical protein
MKKILFALAIMFSLFSCSSSDDSSQISSDVLLKKKIVGEGDGTSFEVTYTYQGNKLVKIISSSGGYWNFKYTGNLITKIEVFDLNSTLTDRLEFYYSGNKLIQTKDYLDGVLFTKTDIVYNSDFNTRTRTVTSYETDPASTSVYKDFYKNEEIIKTQRFNSDATLDYTRTYLYDNYNLPLKNVAGYKYIADILGDESPFHNLTKFTETSTNFNITEDYSYVYNSEGYPITRTSIGSGTTYDTQYFY